MKNKIFSLLLAVLFVFGVSLLVKNQKGYLYVENRPKEQLASIINDFSYDKLNSFMEDSVYERDIINKSFLKLFNMFSIGDKNVCYNREHIKLNDIYFDNSYTRIDNSIINTVANKAFNINEISHKYPNIKTYVYNPVRHFSEPILNTVWFPDNYEEFENTFLLHLGDQVKYKKMDYPDSQLPEYFYKTDHHYNVNGADKAYRDIVEMINEDFDIGKPKDKIKNIELCSTFRGYYSGSSENIGNIYDTLMTGDYGIDSTSYDYYINDEKTSIEVERNLSHSSYDIYFSSNVGKVVFDYHNLEKKNVLVFADSFGGPIKEVLSTHFNKTVFVCGYEYFSKMSLDDLIKENDIDIVLILWMQNNLYYNGYYFIPIN